MDRDYYLSEEEKQRKASSATRVLNFLVKYRDDFLEQKRVATALLNIKNF